MTARARRAKFLGRGCEGARDRRGREPRCKKATKPNAQNPQGGIVEQEASIHISNLQPIDAKTGKATRIGRKVGAKGKLVRYAKKSGEEIK